MKKSIIWLLAIIMGITFAGLLYIQVLYMKDVVKLRDENFSQGVKRSLSEVTLAIEKEDLRNALVEYGIGDVIPAYNGRQATVISLDPSVAVGNNVNISGGQQGGSDLHERVRSQYLYQRALLDEVMMDIISVQNDRPIDQRVDTAYIGELLSSELKANDIQLGFKYAIVNRMGGIIYKSSGYNDVEANANNSFTHVMFANEPSNRVYFLKVYFPDKKDYIFHSIKFLVPSFFLTILLLILSIYTIVVAFRQKKLTEMKNDFINNMTHEFKTPISSISLAAQMLNDTTMTKSPKMLEHISTVINDETKRLRFQVEKVLQMSMFDRQKASLRLQEVDANTAISNIANTFKLKVERYGGVITTSLNAEDAMIYVDEMHFTNVIFNLLDNAVKYRDEDRPLNLSIATRDRDRNLEITVSDNGIGIKKDDLKRVFEKFYRVSTGNRHDVKGFGLGLAYVRKMIREFGGDITVESELKKGTKFIIKLPLTKI